MMGWPGYQTTNTDWMIDLLALILIGILIRVVWYAVSRSAIARHGGTGPRSALEQAEVRYARGEISREEFLDIVNDLYLADSEFKHKRKRSEL
jgi:uncharacterized membrane protein